MVLLIVGINNISIKFRNVAGDCDFSHNSLVSICGSPEEVGGYFDCSYNEF